MSEETKHDKLVRMTLGGVDQLPDFSGDKNDYAYINRVTFRGHKSEEKIKAINLRGAVDVFFSSRKYDPASADDFMLALDEVLENQGWYFVYVTSRDKTQFREHQRMNGALYSKKDVTSRIVSE